MLQGYGDKSLAEVKTSRAFLKKNMKLKEGEKLERAFDFGAGIGRVTKLLLLDHFEKVDLLDQSKVQIDEAKSYVPEADNYYCAGFQDFNFKKNGNKMYDCIWLFA